MKSAKGLEMMECQKVSHEDARTQSFRIKIKAADYEKAMSTETWPYRVRVRIYRHFRQKREEPSQFDQFAKPASRDVRQQDSHPARAGINAEEKGSEAGQVGQGESSDSAGSSHFQH